MIKIHYFPLFFLFAMTQNRGATQSDAGCHKSICYRGIAFIGTSVSIIYAYYRWGIPMLCTDIDPEPTAFSGTKEAGERETMSYLLQKAAHLIENKERLHTLRADLNTCTQRFINCLDKNLVYKGLEVHTAPSRFYNKQEELREKAAKIEQEIAQITNWEPSTT
jgi:hypothetical protein